MRAKIKSFHSPDIDNLENYTPEKVDNFAFLLELLVGPDDQKGEESFSIQICTPLWLLSTVKKEDMVLVNRWMIVAEYNFERIINKIQSVIESYTGETWEDVAKQISRISHWEFEDCIDIAY